jgi:hypothetical protein
MAQPVPRGMRPAPGPRSLTSPEPVTAPATARRHRQLATADPAQESRTSRRTSERKNKHARRHYKITSPVRLPGKRSPEFTRWIEA